MAGDINTRYGNLLTNIKTGQLNKKTSVADTKEITSGNQTQETFLSSSKDKSDTEIFDLGKKFKTEGAGQEIKISDIAEETKTDGVKPKNIQKLEELLSKSDLNNNHIGAMGVGMAGMGAVAGALMSSTGMLTPAGAGALLGAAAGIAAGSLLNRPNDGHYENSKITKSGVEEKFTQDRHNGAVDYTTDYNLPDGTKIHKEYHAKPKENKPVTDMASPQGLQNFIFGGPKDISQSISAVDKEGNKLDAKVVKDEKTGSDRIQVANSNGTITMLDPSNLGFTVTSQTTHSNLWDFQQPTKLEKAIDFLTSPGAAVGGPLSQIGQKSALNGMFGDNRVSLPRETENTAMIETVNPDGSIELILNESSIAVKHRADDPLHAGKKVEEKAPQYHSYTKVNISPDGETKVEKVEENYNVRVKDGHLVSKRTKFADALNSLTQGSLATSLNTEGDFTISNTSKPGIFEKMDPLGSHMNRLLDNREVKPFVTRSQMKEAHNNALERRIEDARKDLLNNEYVPTWSDFAQGMKDAEKMTGKKIDVIGFDACLMADGEKKPEILEAKGSDGTIYLASTDGKLRALTPEGEKKWYSDKNFFGGISATPLPDKENLYVLDKKNTLHCLKAGSHSGLDVWDTDIKGEIIGDPSIDKDGNINIPVKMEGKTVQRTINPKNGMEVKSRIVHTSASDRPEKKWTMMNYISDIS